MINGYIPTCEKKTDKLCDVQDHDFVSIDGNNDELYGKSLRKTTGDSLLEYVNISGTE